MKEKVVISYSKGITHSPSDLICNDGELEECVNLEVRNGELVPMEMPVPMGITLNSGEVLVLVHDIKAGPKNYIVLNGGTLSAFKMSGSTRKDYSLDVDCGELKSIQKLGNTIVAYTSDGPLYILYKNDGYSLIGDRIPEIGLSFDLIGDYVMSDEFSFKAPKADSTTDANYQESVCSSLVPEVNKFIEENATATGKFMYPFFVRYAIRLFDGTHVMQSAPVLMLPSTNIAPFVSSYSDMRNLYDKEFKAQIGAFVAQLEATVSYISGSLSDWSDIVSSLDIFVSRQIVTYDQNGNRFGNAASSGSKFIGKYNGYASTIWDGYALMPDKVSMTPGEGEYLHRWYIPARDVETVISEIVNTSLFYKYTSISLDRLSEGSLHILSGILSDLEVGEALKDDYMTHDVFIPESSFVYNGRLNISNISRKLFGGFPMESMVQMVKSSTQDGFDYGLLYGRYVIYTYIRSADGGDIVVKSDTSTTGALYAPYLFYPDSDAYRMLIVDTSNNRFASVFLTEHALLNGAYAFVGFQPLAFTGGSAGSPSVKDTEIYQNKLYVSNVNNPFHFPLEGMYTVGSDRIIGVSAITRPISQGQFGEFPLIAFCSDGNYALRVDEQGFYTSISPVQEDIVLGSDKITPMENSIMIITKKGLMITSGGEMNKIALQMDGGIFDYSSLESVKTTNEKFVTLVEKSSDDMGFLSYLYGARMAFDYASNRIFIYNPNKTYSYIYKFENDTVSKMVINGGAKVVTSVIDYPDTIIQDETGVLYSLYSKADISTSVEAMSGLMVTRPLKMGGAMDMKAIRQVKTVEANRTKDSFVKYNLYGSNDNVKYYRVSSRFGKPYKYYRVAIYTNLLPKESVSGTALTIEKRRTSKLR